MWGSADSESRPSVGLVIARGAGWGAGLGWLVGIVLPYVVDLLTFRDTPANAAGLLVGWWWTGPVGLIIGLVAGVLTAALFLPLRRSSDPYLAARLVAGLAGPVVVAALVYLGLRPRFAVGPNEVTEHLVERVVILLVPSAATLILGLVFGARLARPDSAGDQS